MALVTDGLIGWWNASEQDGSTWPDLSGNGHDLSVANADWQSDGGIPYLRSDQGDGTKATSSDAAFQLGSGARSLCVWTKYPAGSVADNRGIAGKMSESSPYPGWGLVWNGNGYVVAHIIQDAGSTIMTVTRSSTPDTSWHMVALTYDGSYLKLYYDGSLVGTSGAHTYDTDNAKDFAICGLGSAQSTGVCGNVRAALVYDTCLSATDVSDNYAAGPAAVYHGETPIVDGDYTVISFLASGDFVTPDGVTTVRALRVGGGSAGAKGTPGTCYGGAGAGGGVVEDTSDVSVSGTMAVVVGVGGAGQSAAHSVGPAGADSSFAGTTAYGGAASSSYPSGVGATSGAPQSNAGAGVGGLPHSYEGAGGGGAGGTPSNPQNGGPGVSSSITGTATMYGGGGGGGGDSWHGTGTDGGGDGAAPSGTPTSGVANRGGGGGSMRGDDGASSGSGGSGIVVIRYLTPVSATATLTITSSHRVWNLATKTITSRHKVRPLLFTRKSITSRHLVGYVYTPPPVRLALRSRHIVNGVQGLARLALTSRHQVSGLVRFALTSGHLVRDVDPATLTLTSQHVVGFAARLALTSRHKVPRRTVIIPGSDPPIEVVDDVTLHASFNGINLNNGTTTHVLADGTDVGGNGPEYDTIRHYDGSLLIHDVRGAFSTLTIPLAVKFSSAASLSAWIADINAACLAGGSFVFQESDGATERTYAIAPGPEPSIPENNRFFIQHVAIFDLVLTRWPE